VNPEKVVDKLFKKKTGLKKTFPVSITVIDDYEIVKNKKGDPYISIKELLLRWIDYRREALRVYYLKSLQVNVEKSNMNDVLLMVFSKDNINDTINIAKNSSSRKETIEKYVKKFKINSIQAETIADMHVYNFNKDSYERYKQNAVKLKEEYVSIMKILDSDDEIDNIIVKQLQYGIDSYGAPRRSKVIKPNSDKLDENIPDIDYIVGISENGYIKKIPAKNNTSIGSLSKTNSSLTVLNINNRENILVIDSVGIVAKISVSAIPEMKFSDIGIELSTFFPVNGNIKAVMELPSPNTLKNVDKEMYVIIVTKTGLCKKVLISEFKRLTGSKACITLDDNDEVACATFSIHENSKDIIIYTNKGNGIRIPISEIREYKANAKGLSMISLKDGEYVVGASKINPKKNMLVYITSTGKSKLTELKLFPKMKRNEEPLKLISMTGSESLVGIESVGKNDILILYKKLSEPEEIKISDINLKPRMSSGDKIANIKRSDSVAGYKVFVN
jgi:DNA gyrase/topoisomerase IV subunit A